MLGAREERVSCSWRAEPWLTKGECVVEYDRGGDGGNVVRVVRWPTREGLPTEVWNKAKSCNTLSSFTITDATDANKGQ